MPVRPDDASHFGGIVAIVPQDVDDVLLDRYGHSSLLDLVGVDFGAVLEVLANAQVEEQGVVFGLRRWVLVLDQEGVAARSQVFHSLDRRLHEHRRRHGEVRRGVYDRDGDRVLRLWYAKVWR